MGAFGRIRRALRGAVTDQVRRHPEEESPAEQRIRWAILSSEGRIVREIKALRSAIAAGAPVAAQPTTTPAPANRGVGPYERRDGYPRALDPSGFPRTPTEREGGRP